MSAILPVTIGVELGTLGRRLRGLKIPSAIEEMLAVHIRADKLPSPDREFVFDPTRKWRFDFAWPAIKFAVEVDGEVHRIHERFHADIQKRAHALLQGWTVLHVGGREVRSGEAIAWVRSLLWERT